MKLSTKITAFYLSITLIGFLVLNVLSFRSIRLHFINETKEEMRTTSRALINMINKNPRKNIERNIRSRPSFTTLRATHRLINGIVIAIDDNNKITFSNNPDFKKGNYLDKSFISQINQSKSANETIKYNRIEYLSSITPMKSKNSSISSGKLIYMANLSEIQKVCGDVFNALLGGMLISIGLASVAAIIVTRSLTEPLMTLKKHVNEYSPNKKSEDLILKTNDEIEDLANAFNHLSHRITNYDISQKRFLQNISHELKSPLMSIQGYAEGIKDGIFEKEEAEKGLTVIIEESQRLKSLVNQIIYLSKIESMDEIFNFEKLDIVDLLNETIQKINGLAISENKTVEFEFNEKCFIKGDRAKLQQVFINILSNGIRHAKTSVKINTEESKDTITFKFLDDGEGFKKDDLNRLFERFYKGNKGDTGLGMAITKAILDKHNAPISAANSADGGAEFTVAFNKLRV